MQCPELKATEPKAWSSSGELSLSSLEIRSGKGMFAQIVYWGSTLRRRMRATGYIQLETSFSLTRVGSSREGIIPEPVLLVRRASGCGA